MTRVSYICLYNVLYYNSVRLIQRRLTIDTLCLHVNMIVRKSMSYYVDSFIQGIQLLIEPFVIVRLKIVY